MSGDRNDLDVLRRWFRDRPPGDSTGDACPDADRVLKAVLGELPASERRALADHAAGCAECAAAWRLAHDFSREAELRPARRRVAAWRWVGAAAAVLILAIAAPLVVRQFSPERGEPALRSIRHDVIEALTPPDRALPADTFALTWSPGPEGTRYDVRVLDTRLNRVAGARSLNSAEYTVPVEALTGLEPGTILLWQVDATLPDGRRISSETFSARLE